MNSRLFVTLLCLIGTCATEQCEWKIDGEFVTDLIEVVKCGDFRARVSPDHRIECFHVEHRSSRETAKTLPTAITVRFQDSTDESEMFYYAAHTVHGLQTSYCLTERGLENAVCNLQDLGQTIAPKDIRIDAGWMNTETGQVRRERCTSIRRNEL